MNTGILGAGNGGLALYAMMLNSPNFEPLLFASPAHLQTINTLLSSPSAIRFEHREQEAAVEIEHDSFYVTHSVADLLSQCSTIVNTLPINAHIPVFDEIYKVLAEGEQRIEFINLSGGFAVFDHLAKQQTKEIASIASAHTLPYASRVSKGAIRILNRRKETLISLSNSTLRPTIAALEDVMGTPLTVDDNHLHCAIDRSSYIMHPLITMLNFTRIERKETFYFFRDGWTSSIERLLVDTGHERRRLCERLGFHDFILPEARVRRFVDTYLKDFKNVLPPASAEHRFFIEDISYGLVFMCTLGRILGVSMPLSESVVNIASSMCGKDFWDSPLNLLRHEALAGVVLSYRSV